MSLSIGQLGQIACLWEATARKPGNVHRFRDFDNLTYLDFVLSAAAITPALDRATSQRVGQTVLEGVRATRAIAATNTNLGIMLLLAPFATVPANRDLPAGIEAILSNLNLDDSNAVYQAIRLANPGGMGQVEDQDILDRPTLPLRDIMRLASDRDLIARQYVDSFPAIFDVGLPSLQQSLAATKSLETAIIATHLELLARFPDSLIVRKLGLDEATAASRRAEAVLQAGWPTTVDSRRLLDHFDDWLRAEGNRRNPGTSADLVAATLFAALRDELIDPVSVTW